MFSTPTTQPRRTGRRLRVAGILAAAAAVSYGVAHAIGGTRGAQINVLTALLIAGTALAVAALFSRREG